jgi:hypothetical protein
MFDKIIEHDGLILAHLDFYTTTGTAYRRNILEAFQLFQRLKKPVFAVESKEPQKKDYEILKLLSDALWIDESPEKRQEEVDYISGVIGRKPENISLAFGGMFGPACVYTLATSWCKKVEIYIEPYGKKQKPPERPIGFGKIFGEISLISNPIAEDVYITTIK